MKIAVVDKALNNTRYDKHFQLYGEEVDVFHMCNEKLSGRLLKKHITIGTIDNPFDPNDYDFVVLVGAEPFLYFAGKKGIGDYSGKRVENGGYANWIASISPAQLHFKPEMKPVFDATVESIHDIINGREKIAKGGDYRPITVSEEAEEYIKMVYNMIIGPIAFDSETSALYCRDGYLLGVSISHQEYQGVYIDADCITEVAVHYLQKILDSQKHQIVFHNLKFDMHFYSYHLGLSFEKASKERRLHDTMLQHYVLDERRGTHGLKSLAMKYTDMGDYDFELDKFKDDYCKAHKIKKEDFSYDLIPFDIMWPYACLTHDSQVQMASGNWKTIGELVRTKSTEAVVSFNESTGQFENKPITGWYKNEHKSKEWKKLVVKSQQRNSRGTINGPVFTPDHRVLTQNGYIEVQDITPGQDKILTEELALPSDSKQVLMASLFGDGALVSRNNWGAGLQLTQSEAHKEYLDFKAASQVETPTLGSSTKGDKKAYTYNFPYTSEYSDLFSTLEVRDNTTKYKLKITKKNLEGLDEKALAIWYQDDGTLPQGNARIWSRTVADCKEEQQNFIEWCKNLGITAHYHNDGENNQFFVLDNEELFPLIAPYMHSSMAYKVPERFKHLVGIGTWDFSTSKYYYAEVYGIEDWVVPASRRGYSTSWCIDVKDNHNFVTKVGVVHNCKDTDATLRLHNFFLPKIEKNSQLNSLYYDVLMPGCVFLQRVEDRGVPISVDRLKEAQYQLTNQLNRARERLYTFPEVARLEADRNEAFNPNSVIQLRTLLFDYVGLPPTGKLTDTGADSTNAEALNELALLHPIAKTLLEIRKVTKLISTYVEKILLGIDKDGCIRTGFHEHMTTSGRLSSSGKLNLQQLPRDESIIKGCVVAPKGYRVISWDLTTAEVYYAAVLSGDRNMQQVFINMKNEPDKYPDFHSNIAHMVFKLTCEPRDVKKLFPALRQAAKAITFGILYGSGPSKVAHSVNEALLEQSAKTGEPFVECTTADAKDYIETYFTQFPQLKRWIDKCHDQIKNFGFIYSHFGRKRRLHNINSDDRGVQGEEIRSGFNAIIQSASSDSLLVGAVDADNEILSLGLGEEMKIVMLVHDSVVAIVREDLIDQYNEILIRNIQKDRGISIPGCPIGIDSDSEKGGSRDYSCGKTKKQHPSIACIDDDEFTKLVKKTILDAEFEYKKTAALDKSHPDHKLYAKDDVFVGICKDLTEIERVLGA